MNEGYKMMIKNGAYMSKTGKKILVIDNDKTQINQIKNGLEMDFEVFCANSDKEALEHFTRGLIPDLILVDILMIKRRGWELYHFLRGISLLQSVPIAIITSEPQKDEETKAKKIGVKVYLERTSDAKELKGKILNILDGR